VVSTSALELGLDIPNLDAAVLLGVPASATSLYQRIGRIGRHRRGTVYLIHTGSHFDEAVFRRPESLFSRPPAENALYLDNPRIQYIHALCLARIGGEHDQAAPPDGDGREEGRAGFESAVEWPAGFLELCRAERIGAIHPELQQMKAEAGDDPNRVFPLRDVESQFKVELRQGPEQRDLGALSFSQALREAYPGAVYYYMTQTFRVYKVAVPSKLVLVRKEKRYSTKPLFAPPLVFPNLTEGNVHAALESQPMTLIECNLQIRESVVGFRERRGAGEFNVTYPTAAGESGVFFPSPRFSRNYFSSGVILTHPAFRSCPKEALDQLAGYLLDAFLFQVPLERQDVEAAVDRHRVDWEPHFREGDRFIAVYDQTYGSLRLSGKILEEPVLGRLFEQALEFARIGPAGEALPETVRLLEALREAGSRPPRRIDPGAGAAASGEEDGIEVIAPGSVGMALIGGNREYRVESVFYSPKQNELCYRGRYLDQSAADTSVVILPVGRVVPVPGVSRLGRYDEETGEVRGIAGANGDRGADGSGGAYGEFP